MTPNINDLFAAVRFKRIEDLLKNELKQEVDQNELFECIHQFLHLCDNAKEIAPAYEEIATWVETLKRLTCYQISKEILTLDRYRLILLSPDIITKFIYNIFGLPEQTTFFNRLNDYDLQFKTGASKIDEFIKVRNTAAHEAQNYYKDRVNALKQIESYLDIFIMMFYVIKSSKKSLSESAQDIISKRSWSKILINVVSSNNSINITDVSIFSTSDKKNCNTDTINGIRFFKVNRFNEYRIKCNDWKSDPIVFDEGYTRETTIEIAPPDPINPNSKLEIKKILLSQNNLDHFKNEFPSLITLITEAENKSDEALQCALKVVKAAILHIVSEGNNNCLKDEIDNLCKEILANGNFSDMIDAKVDEFHKKLSNSGPDFEKFCELLDDLYNSTTGIFGADEIDSITDQITKNAIQFAENGNFCIANSMISQIINRQKELTKIFYGIKNIDISHSALLDQFKSNADELSREIQPLINKLSSAISNLDSLRTKGNNVADKIGPWISFIRWAFVYADQRYQLLFLTYNINIIETLSSILLETLGEDNDLYKELSDAYISVIGILDSYKLKIHSNLYPEYKTLLDQLKVDLRNLKTELKKYDDQSSYLSILETIALMSNDALAILLMGNGFSAIWDPINVIIIPNNYNCSRGQNVDPTSAIREKVKNLHDNLFPQVQASNDDANIVCDKIISEIKTKYSTISDYLGDIIEMTHLSNENPWLKSYLLVNALIPDTEDSFCRLCIIETLMSIDNFNNMSWALRNSIMSYLAKNASTLIEDIKNLKSIELQTSYLHSLMQIDAYYLIPHKKIEIFNEIFRFLKNTPIISLDDFYGHFDIFLQNTTRLNSLDSLNIEHLEYLKEMDVNVNHYGLKENWIKDLKSRITYLEKDNAKSNLVTIRRVVSAIRTSNLPNLCDEIIRVIWSQSSEQEMKYVDGLWEQILSKLKDADANEKTIATDKLCKFLGLSLKLTIDYKLSKFEELQEFLSDEQKNSFIERILISIYNTLTFDKTISPDWKAISEIFGKLIDWANRPEIKFKDNIRINDWAKYKYVIDNFIDID